MQTDCFPDAASDRDKKPIGKLATINPRYKSFKGREYPFIEMAAVAEQFGGIQYITTLNFEGSGLAKFKVGDTLFAKITPCPENGKVAFVGDLPDELGIGSTEFIVLSPRECCGPRFLYHLACCHEVRGRAIGRMEGSTGRQRVPDDAFKKRLIVPAPSLEEQAAIARILDAVDTAIERAQDATNRAQELRRSLLQSLLSVGLDRKGLVRNRSHHEFAVYRHARFPQAWQPSSIGAEFDLQTGFTLNESRRPRYRVRRYLRVANVQRDHLSLHDVAELEARDTEFALRRLELNDLLVVEGHADRMQIGRCAAVSPEAVGLTFQNHLFRLRTRGRVISEFAVLWMNSEFAQRYWNARCATSSGLNTINQGMLLRMFLPVPDEREQSRIIDVVQSQRTHLEALTGEQRALNDLKRSLMHDLLTGEIRTDQLELGEVAA
jgi:type I restriction enzyme S subunit